MTFSAVSMELWRKPVVVVTTRSFLGAAWRDVGSTERAGIDFILFIRIWKSVFEDVQVS